MDDNVKTGKTKRGARPYIEVENHGPGVSVWVTVIHSEDVIPNNVRSVLDGARIMAMEALDGE